MLRQSLIFAVAAAALAAASPSARGAEADELVKRSLAWDSPEHEEHNLAFSVMDGRVAFGICGSAKVTASYDFGCPVESPDIFATSAIPVGVAAGDGGQWAASARQSSISISSVLLPASNDRVGIYVNFNFLGDNYAPLLQYACLKWRFLTAGYAYTVFSDNDAAAPTIDFQGPNSFTGIQNTVFNFEGRLDRSGRISGGIGLDAPMASYEAGEGSRWVKQRVPDVPAYLQYNIPDGHVRFSAILRNLIYRDIVAGHNVDKLGWGVKLSGVVPIAGGLEGFFQVLYGRGITSYYQDLTDCGLDLVGNGLGSMTPLKSWGGYAGLHYDLASRWHLSGAYSHIRLYPGAGDQMPDLDTTYRYAQYAVGTLTYDITDWLSGGLEYIYGRRKQLDGASYHDNRLMIGLQATF